MKAITSVSTMNCIIRKSIWEEYPFDENLLKLVPETRKYGGEDYDWNLEMISTGYKTVLDPKFSVVHFHEKDLMLEIFRNIRNYFVYEKINRKIKSLKRPRKSYTKVNNVKKHSIEI